MEKNVEHSPQTERLLSIVFKIGLIFKGIDGFFELIGGVLLLFISPTHLGNIIRDLTQHEITQDPNDFIATHLRHFASNLTGSWTLFAAIYLLLHGVVKLVLAWAVFANKLWAFPWMIAFLAIFVVYQIYEIIVHPSLGLTLLTVFDLIIIWLTIHEYRLRRRKLETTQQAA